MKKIMKTEKKYFTTIGNKLFQVNDEKTHVKFHNEWAKIETQPWGEDSITLNNGRVIYIGTIGAI